jgi:hypothetical protein
MSVSRAIPDVVATTFKAANDPKRTFRAALNKADCPTGADPHWSNFYFLVYSIFVVPIVPLKVNGAWS